MKKSVPAVILTMMFSVTAFAQRAEIVKTGLNFGPIPAIAFDADKGFQYGAILNIYDYGDGSAYPNFDSKWYLEASAFTKGSLLFTVMHDNKVLIPGIRWATAVTAAIDKAMDFYGFNGYGSYYDADRVDAGKKNPDKDPALFQYTPYYRMSRVQILGKSDFIGDITDRLHWEAGVHVSYFKTGAIDRKSVNKNKAESDIYPDHMSTLFEDYLDWGLISREEKDGGFVGSIRAGLVYDTRDKEGAPSRGIWAEGHLSAAPRWLGTTNPFLRYSMTWRQYLPIVTGDVLTFAYRLNYEGTIGSSAPFYVLPYMTVMGDFFDRDGMGGYRTARGLLRDRVVGLDMATYTAELRWRFISFPLLNQNIALGLSAFSDGSMVTRGRDLSFRGGIADRSRYDSYMANSSRGDSPHITAGAGFRFIMNQNFIVAVEYGKPFNRQDGNGALYINTGYLF